MKVLGVVFSPHEAVSLAGFASSISASIELLVLPEDALADALAKTIAGAAFGCGHLVAVSSMRAKDVMPRVAGLLDAPMVTDVSESLSPTVFKRPVVAGSIIATVEVLSEPVVLTIRPAGFPKVDVPSLSAPLPVLNQGAAKRLSKSSRSGGRPDLTQAKIVVTGGRPLKDADTFERVIGGLADDLGGAVGATRAAVDSGIAPNELQVGQTGKIVAPDLYVAAGVSGSTQHVAGIKDSKVIVAINKDPDAPIFEIADLGIVADLFEAIPEIRAKLGGP